MKDFCGKDVDNLFTATDQSFKIVWYSNTNEQTWKNYEQRGQGPAGALVRAGPGDAVDEADIWSGKLNPGALVQVWKKKADYDKVREGKESGDIGHSFVFLEYVKSANGKIEGMKIADQGTTWTEPKTLTKAEFETWFAANVKCKP